MQPISAVLVNQRVHDAMLAQSDRFGNFAHGYTYAGHPVAAAVALEVQKMTLATLKGMNFNMGDVANALKLKAADTMFSGVQKVSDDDEAVRSMNDSPYGLTAAIWTRDQERAFRIGAQIETGTFFMNRCDYLDPMLPWTGVKDTGKGMSLSKYGFLPLTRRKSFHLRTQT